MHILVSNDDGCDAPGLEVLVNVLKDQYHKVTVVTPRQNMSGCGMGMSLRKSIQVENINDDTFVVDGTPVDCVYIGLNNLVTESVDLVISGINNGANLADDVFYSGTFAAAMEARRLYLPSIALSVVNDDVKHYETAAYIASELANEMPRLEYKSLLAVLNVNVPDVPTAQLRGLKATILGERLEPVKPTEELDKNTNNIRRFVLGAAGDFDRRKRKIMADFQAVEEGFVSVTPLGAKLEDRAYIQDTQSWLDDI